MQGVKKILAKSCLRRSLSRSVGNVAAASAPDWGVVLDGTLIKNADFQANKSAMETLVTNLKKTVHKIHQGGGEKACAKHKARGKLLARERIDGLVDAGTPFLEFSPLAGYEMYGEGGVPSGGVVTGIGRVSGYVIMCLDYTFLFLVLSVLRLFLN